MNGKDEKTGRIAVVGDRDSVLGFMAVGFEVYEAKNAREAAEAVAKLARDGFAVIYLTQTYASAPECTDVLASYSSSPLPAIIPIPDKKGGGYGEANLRRAVERAIGADIIFKDN